jgi:hypothetical protein
LDGGKKPGARLMEKRFTEIWRNVVQLKTDWDRPKLV